MASPFPDGLVERVDNLDWRGTERRDLIEMPIDSGIHSHGLCIRGADVGDVVRPQRRRIRFDAPDLVMLPRRTLDRYGNKGLT
jgi:Uma2 family endonuclease